MSSSDYNATLVKILAGEMQGDIVCGDCLDVMGQMPDGCVDLIYADMIYDDLDFSWLDECFRLLAINGSIYVQTDYRSAAQVKLKLDSLGTFRNWIVWCYRTFPARQTRWYDRRHDDIFFYTRSDNHVWNDPKVPASETTKVRWQHHADNQGMVSAEHLTAGMTKNGLWKDRKVNCKETNCPDWWYFPIVGRGKKA